MSDMTKAELLAENKRLRQALSWYADGRNWNTDDWGIVAVVQPPEYGRPGTKARRALRLDGKRDLGGAS